MKIYLIGVPASSHAIRIKTGEVYDNITDLGNSCLDRFKEIRELNCNFKFEEFIRTGHHVVCFEFELNKRGTYHKIYPNKLWEMLNKEDSLKSSFTKLKLRNEFE